MAEADAPAFFTVAQEKRAEAEAAAPDIVEKSYRVADRLLRIRFLGGALIPVIAPALSHLEVNADAAPDLTLHCFDCASLGLDYPDAPVGKDAFTPRGEISGLNRDGFHAAFEPGGRLLSLMHASSREALYCVGDAAAIPRFDIAEPVRVILAWFMRTYQRQLVHAGAVGLPDGGVLLLGRSGAGKSNTALSALKSNLFYASDDFCAVSTIGPPMAYSIYATGKTRQEDWARHPFLASLAPNFDPLRRDKIVYFLNAAVPGRLITRFPVRAVLLVERGGDACVARPVSPAVALSSSARDTARLLPDARGEVIASIGRLVRTVPCFELVLGPDPARVCPTIEALLQRLRQGRSGAVEAAAL